VDDVLGFYDAFASDYELAYGGRWDEAVRRQGAALDELIRASLPDAADVLDCACGIGTQAIGLALRGYRVHGTDLSEAEIGRARREAERLGADVSFGVADFRDLSRVEDDFDVVICCDNALPHLLDEADLPRAFAAMHAKLRPGGLLVVTMRDFDAALADRPPLAPPALVAGPPRRVLVRLHDWDEDRPCYTVRYLVLTEGDDGWSVAEHATRYRAITRAELEAAAGAVGFEELAWPDARIVGDQRVLTALRP